MFFALLLAFIVGMGLVMALYVGSTKLPGMLAQRKLMARLDSLAPVEQSEAPSATLLKASDTGALPAFERMMAGTTRGSAIGRWIEQSGMRVSLSGVFLMAAGLGVVMAMVATMVTRTPMAMPLGFALGFALPFLLLRMKRTRRLRKFEEEFPEALDLIARALKAGHAFATGLKMVADEMEEPVGPEFRKTFDEQNFGLPLKDALENLTLRIPILDVRFFATAVLIQRETGGNLSEILENLAHVVRERFKILRQVRVYTAHGRLTGYVLLALPAFLGVALSFINPEHMNLLFRERMGQMMLIAAMVMQFIGYMWIKQVVKIEV
ncbi:MAG TPA: type II secretion system F family protein [Vicinamibacterales bacterium]|jgi:tight adherence protein B|nr:type II secretion system F family protein [Vicinamibacterales bacterium]